MSTIVTRAGKGSALTWVEADTNFTNLNTDKVEYASLAADSGSSLVGFLPDGIGAVATDAQSKLREIVSVKDFGALGDWNGTTGTDDTAAIQAAIDYAAANKVKLLITGGNYRVVGVLKTRSNLHIEFDNDAWICPTAWNAYGGVLTNVADAPVQSNVFIDNPQFDGQGLPTDGLGNSNAMGFANGASFFRINGGYIKNFAFSWSAGGAGGKAVNFESGVTDSMITNVMAENCGCAAYVAGYDGTNNAASRIIVSNIVAKNCEVAVAVLGITPSLSGTGSVSGTVLTVDTISNSRIAIGAAVSGTGITAGTTITSFGTGTGGVGTYNLSASSAATGSIAISISDNPDGDAADSMVIIDGVTFYNCGHAPSRPIGAPKVKSGAIVLGEAQNVRISNVKGYNAPTYPNTSPGYPTDSGAVAYGLSGPIGAVIWGWGRNITISNVEYHGDCDQLIMIQRARALGEDAGGTGIPENVFRFDVDGLRHYGTATYVLDKQSNITNANLTGTLLNIFPDTVSTGFMSSNMNGMSGIYCQLRSVLTNGKSVSGTADALFDGCNTFAASSAGVLFKGQTVEHVGWKRTEFTLADDTATSFTPNFAQGVLVISSATSALRAIVSYRADVTPQCVNMGTAVANFAVTTGVLTGTTGTDTNYTVSAATDGKIYLENRRGGAVNVSIIELG